MTEKRLGEIAEESNVTITDIKCMDCLLLGVQNTYKNGEHDWSSRIIVSEDNFNALSGTSIYVYHCISNNRIKKGVCPGVFIFEKELLDALADMIQEQLDTTLGQYSLGLENLTKEAEEQKNIQAKIFSRKQEIQQLRTYQRGLYEGLIQNHLSKDEYFTFKEKYEAKIEAISEEIEQLKAGLAILAKQLEQYKMLSQDAQHIKEDRQLTAALIDRLIDRVEVSREKRITVRFRFQSEFEHCEEVLSQCRNM